MGGWGHAPPALRREWPGTHCIGGWVCLRVGRNRYGKSCPPPGFDPQTVLPVASRYTDWAIPALIIMIRIIIIVGDWYFCQYVHSSTGFTTEEFWLLPEGACNISLPESVLFGCGAHHSRHHIYLHAWNRLVVMMYTHLYLLPRLRTCGGSLV